MKNYEELIISACKGGSPKEKYEWLFDQLTKLSVAKSFIYALHGTWDEVPIKTIRSFIDSTNQTLNG